MSSDKKHYYLKQFDKIEKRKWSWNWSACFFIFYWAIYRKMYVTALILAAISLLINTVIGGICVLWIDNIMIQNDFCKLMNAIFIANIVQIIVTLTMFIVFGFLGNRLYYSSIKHRISEGYHLNENYSSTNIALPIFMLGSFIILVVMILFGYISTITYIILSLVSLVLLPILFCLYRDRQKLKKDIQHNISFSKDITIENISKLI